MVFKAQGKMRFLLHFAAWIIIIGLPLYNFYRWDIPREFIWTYYLLVVINGIIFYCNYFLLIPRFFFRNRRIRYYLSALILIAALFCVSHVAGFLIFQKAAHSFPRESADRIERMDDRPPRGPRKIFRLPFGPMSVYNFAFNAIVFSVFAFGIKVLERHAEIEKKQKELEKEKLNSELAFLKSQISPHFFFNTLNNIYSLIDINKEDSQKAVLKLSKMMRYLLYESEQGETRLGSEIEFMNNYIDLMRLRVSDKIKLDISFPAEHDDRTIPPLLFISIIENAFKHGISYREKSFISINMNVSGNILIFNCENSLVRNPVSESSGSLGIGLENLKKRLSLLFPSKYELNIERTVETFCVSIKINLT